MAKGEESLSASSITFTSSSLLALWSSSSFSSEDEVSEI